MGTNPDWRFGATLPSTVRSPGTLGRCSRTRNRATCLAAASNAADSSAGFGAGRRDRRDEELRRRVADIDNGTAKLIPAEEVFAEVRRLLK